MFNTRSNTRPNAHLHWTTGLTLLAWLSVSVVLSTTASAQMKTQPQAREPEREWTFMFFENGKNNLERFLFEDINEMELVGSTDQMNVVVQWGSYSQNRVTRHKIIRDSDMKKIASPVVQDLGESDMGDYRQIVDFAVWAMKNYPAKRYFLSISDHGSGWRKFRNKGFRGISWDDHTGSFINTPQLGLAMKTIFETTKRKIDIYGSDACLMAMVEVATESYGFVDYFAGSQELEPGKGWEYTKFLGGVAQALATRSQANRGYGGTPTRTRGLIDPRDIVKHLTKTYMESYDYSDDTTFSGFDMSMLPTIMDGFRKMGEALQKAPAADLERMRKAIDSAQRFDYGDYADFVHMLQKIEELNASALPASWVQQFRAVLQKAIFVSATSPSRPKAQGLSIWMPSSRARGLFEQYVGRYKELRFDRVTGWSNALNVLVPANPNAGQPGGGIAPPIPSRGRTLPFAPR